MHAVCSMVEDMGKMIHRTEVQLQQKVPIIDNLYLSLSNLQMKTDEINTNSSTQIAALK